VSVTEDAVSTAFCASAVAVVSEESVELESAAVVACDESVEDESVAVVWDASLEVGAAAAANVVAAAAAVASSEVGAAMPVLFRKMPDAAAWPWLSFTEPVEPAETWLKIAPEDAATPW